MPTSRFSHVSYSPATVQVEKEPSKESFLDPVQPARRAAQDPLEGRLIPPVVIKPRTPKGLMMKSSKYMIDFERQLVESETPSSLLKPVYNSTTESIYKFKGSRARRSLLWSPLCAMGLFMAALLGTSILLLLILRARKQSQQPQSHWRYTRIASTGMLLILLSPTLCCATSNGSKDVIVSGSIPYVPGKWIRIHSAPYKIPELALETTYTVDMACGTDTLITTTSGIECSPISDGVVESGKWSYWQDQTIGPNSHYRKCEYKKTFMGEYGCALGGHQHCFAAKVEKANVVYIAHKSGSRVMASTDETDVEPIPEQEFILPPMAAFDNEHYYENSESYAIIASSSCFVYLPEEDFAKCQSGKCENYKIRSDMAAVNYDLASMHWHMAHPTLAHPHHTKLPATKDPSGNYVVRILIHPKTIKLEFYPPKNSDDHCKLECSRTTAADISSVYEYSGDNVVTVTATSTAAPYCKFWSGDKVYHLTSGESQRIGISSPDITNSAHKTVCPYVRVQDWSSPSQETSSDFTTSFLDLKGVLKGADRILLILLGLGAVYILGPTPISLFILAFVAYESGLISGAHASPIPIMTRCDNAAMTIEIAVVIAQALLGPSFWSLICICVPGLLFIIYYPYRSERVNFIATCRIIIASFYTYAIIRVIAYTLLILYRESPVLKRHIRDAVNNAKLGMDYVEIRSCPNTPVVRAHSVEAALARVKILQKKKRMKPSYYFVNRPVVNRIERPGKHSTAHRPYVAFSRVRQVSGTVFYPEEYEVFRKHIKHMSTLEIVVLKNGATWIHGRDKWDFTEVAPYAPTKLEWILAAHSIR